MQCGLNKIIALNAKNKCSMSVQSIFKQYKPIEKSNSPELAFYLPFLMLKVLESQV